MLAGKKADKAGKPDWATEAVVYSTTMCPGIGQLMQRRWAAGLFYLLSSLAVCVLLILYIGRLLVVSYKIFMVELQWTLTAAGGMADRAPSGMPPPFHAWGALLWSFVLLLLLYSANVMDVIIAAKRLGATSPAPPPPVPKGEP